MGFRAGTASTWPTWLPTVVNIGGTSSLVFRMSPDTGLVFLAGTITVPAGSLGAVRVLNDTPAPAAFRPKAQFVLDPANGAQTAFDTNGNIIGNWTGRAATYTGGTWRTFYFSDTSTP